MDGGDDRGRADLRWCKDAISGGARNKSFVLGYGHGNTCEAPINPGYERTLISFDSPFKQSDVDSDECAVAQSDWPIGWKPISVNLIKGLGMYFVPEGQHDSSQVRSAWVAIEKDPVPEGRSKLLSVPEIFVVETELTPLQKRQILLFTSL